MEAAEDGLLLPPPAQGRGLVTVTWKVALEINGVFHVTCHRILC